MRRLANLAVPNYLALLSGVVAGVIDVAWVARLGPAPVAAVAVATSVENALLGLVLLINGGLTVVISGRLGAGDHAAARATARAGWWLYAAITPAVVLGGLALRGTLSGWLLPDPHAAALATTYFAILFPGVAIFYAQQVVDGTFAGHGDTRTPMRLALLANGLLLILDPLLIYGPGPLPAFGIAGAAAATTFGRAASLAIGLLLLRRRFSTRPEPRKPTWPAVRAVARTGTPIAGDFLVRMAGALAIVVVVGHSGVAAVAAYGIGIKVLYFATMAFYAIRNAATIHTPRTLSALPTGDRDPQRRAIARQTLTLALAAGALAAVLLAALAQPIMHLFTDDPAVLAVGVTFLRCIGGYLVPIAAVIALGGFLMASGKGPTLFAITVVGMSTQSALAWYFAAHLGVIGVWLAMAAAALLQVALVLSQAGLRKPNATEKALSHGSASGMPESGRDGAFADQRRNRFRQYRYRRSGATSRGVNGKLLRRI